MAQLLALGTEGPHEAPIPHANASAAEALRQLLATLSSVDGGETLSLDAVRTTGDRPVAAAFGSEAQARRATRSIGELLTDRRTDLATITAIKDYGKGLVHGRGEESALAAATAVYYAAIAAALVHHGRKITSYSHVRLVESFDRLIGRPWLTAEIDRLLSDARRLCDKESGQAPAETRDGR
jgi:hypothetical protein